MEATRKLRAANSEGYLDMRGAFQKIIRMITLMAVINMKKITSTTTNNTNVHDISYHGNISSGKKRLSISIA